MRNNTKQKGSSTLVNLVLVSLVLLLVWSIFLSIMGAAQRRQASMDNFAATHNCQWQDNGTFYGDDRDYTCK